MYFKYNEDVIVHLARYFNQDLIALAPIRRKQDNKFVDMIRERAIEKMNGAPKLHDSRLFYAGSVDFMVTESKGKNKFVILEANGGSSRGLLSLTFDQVEMIFNAYKIAIDESTKKKKKFVLIGRMPIDNLYQEKIMLMEYLKYRYQNEGFTVGNYTPLNYNPQQKEKEDIILILSDYEILQKQLSFHDQQVFFRNEPVDILIGDGIARRFSIMGPEIKKDWRKVKTRIVNPIYHITDDKFNTYLAEYLGFDILNMYNIQHLKFGKVFNKSQLKDVLKKIISKKQSDFIIKPFGGSGGAGILPILKKISREQIPEIIEKSIFEFHQKFNSKRTPFPYTIQEMAKFRLINWDNSKRAFDLRIYVAQQDGRIIPVGGEARIARAPFTGEYKKNEFFANICGNWGVEFERAYAFSIDALKTLKMSVEDLTNIFCAACKLFSIISEKYKEILSFNQWMIFL